MTVPAWVSLAAAGIFVVLLGILIAYGGRVELIAGYDPDRVTDEDGLANFIGRNAIYVALLALGCAAILYTALAGEASVVWIAFVVGTLGLTARMLRGAKRYEQSATV